MEHKNKRLKSINPDINLCNLLHMGDLMKELLYFCSSKSLKNLSLTCIILKDIIYTKIFIDSYISFKSEYMLYSEKEIISYSRFFHFIKIIESRRKYFTIEHINKVIYFDFIAAINHDAVINELKLSNNNIIISHFCGKNAAYKSKFITIENGCLRVNKFTPKCDYCGFFHQMRNIGLSTFLENKIQKKLMTRHLKHLSSSRHPICIILFYFEFIHSYKLSELLYPPEVIQPKNKHLCITNEDLKTST